MFTGIVEATGRVEAVTQEGTNFHYVLSAPFAGELQIDQSVAHDGCCLTVTDISVDTYSVTAIAETLKKTNLSGWKAGSLINLERCLQMNGRLDGHIVQGHVDTIGTVVGVENKDGSFLITIEYPAETGFLTVPQGSITVNGVSLTVAASRDHSFSVAIIPYTWEHTNMKKLIKGATVNLEFDIIGKYIAKYLSSYNVAGK